MDSSPIRIYVQKAWKPEIIIEESEEDLEAFNNDSLLPVNVATFAASRPLVVKMHRLKVPSLPTYSRRPKKQKKKKRRARSVRKAKKMLLFLTKWSQKKKRIKKLLNKNIFVEKIRTAPIIRPSYSPHVGGRKAGEHWIYKYLPLSPTSSILYWYVTTRIVKCLNPCGYSLSLSRFRWLLLVSCSVLYSCFMVIVRETYDQLNDAVLGLWLTLDYISDAIYLIDMGMNLITSKFCNGKRSHKHHFWKK